MDDILDRQLFGFMGRFGLVHVFAYLLVGLLFVSFQPLLLAADQVTIAFFQPYRPLEPVAVFSQILRATVLATVLYPFGDILVRSDRGWQVLFAVLWGLTVLGSIEPMPGSIEGVIYTETTLTAHFVTLAATALQIALFSWIFLHWQRRAETDKSNRSTSLETTGQLSLPTSGRATIGYLGRFSILYALVYLAAGIVFFQLQDYEAVLATREAYELYRPLDHPLVMAAVPIQLFRGGLLALILLPFYARIFESNRGSFLLFGLLWGCTFLGSSNALFGLVTDLLSTGPLLEIAFGTTEVTVQLGLFSILLWKVERWALIRRREAQQ